MSLAWPPLGWKRSSYRLVAQDLPKAQGTWWSRHSRLWEAGEMMTSTAWINCLVWSSSESICTLSTEVLWISVGRGEQLCQGDTDLVIPIPQIKSILDLRKVHTMSREARSRFCRWSVNGVISCPCWELKWSRRFLGRPGKAQLCLFCSWTSKEPPRWLGC